MILRRFNVDIMILNIPAIDDARKLKLCYVPLLSINKTCQYGYA